MSNAKSFFLRKIAIPKIFEAVVLLMTKMDISYMDEYKKLGRVNKYLRRYPEML